MIKKLTPVENRQMDKAKLAFGVKWVVTWGLVVQNGGVMIQRPKMLLNQLMASVNSFDKLLDQSLGKQDAQEAQDFVDDLSYFFEQFMTADIDDRQKIIDFVNSLSETKSKKKSNEN